MTSDHSADSEIPLRPVTLHGAALSTACIYSICCTNMPHPHRRAQHKMLRCGLLSRGRRVGMSVCLLDTTVIKVLYDYTKTDQPIELSLGHGLRRAQGICVRREGTSLLGDIRTWCISVIRHVHICWQSTYAIYSTLFARWQQPCDFWLPVLPQLVVSGTRYECQYIFYTVLTMI